jgi:DNA ligase-1
VNEKDLKTKIAVQAFDILFLNGKSLLKETLQERRHILREVFKAEDG